MLLAGATITEHVIDAARKTANFINRFRNSQIDATVALLVPEGDPLALSFAGRVDVIEGPEHDVLSRYILANEMYSPDYIVRLTGDTPMVPPPMISKLIKTAVQNQIDFCSNAHPDFRTAPDGWDAEMMSSEILNWMDSCKDMTDSEREHVTLRLYRSPPNWARLAWLLGYKDDSGTKISVDTKEDLKNISTEYIRLEEKIAAANRSPGMIFRYLG